MKEEDKEFFIKKINENRLKMYKTAIAILNDEKHTKNSIITMIFFYNMDNKDIN